MLPESNPSKMRGYIVVGILIVVAIGALSLPFARTYWLRGQSEEVSLPRGQGRDLELITVLARDAIPAITDPKFADGPAAYAQMRPHERVLAVSINEDHRAYPLNMLSRHEIVNDVVGGVPVAVTW